MDDTGIKQGILDEEHLRLLRIGYLVSAGTTGLFALFGIFYALMGVVFGAIVAHSPGNVGEPPPLAIGWVFGAFGLVITSVMGTLAGLKLGVARCLGHRTSRSFCMVVAAISCLGIPDGTVLGVFTYLVLSRPSVAGKFTQQGSSQGERGTAKTDSVGAVRSLLANNVARTLLVIAGIMGAGLVLLLVVASVHFRRVNAEIARTEGGGRAQLSAAGCDSSAVAVTDFGRIQALFGGSSNASAPNYVVSCVVTSGNKEPSCDDVARAYVEVVPRPVGHFTARVQVQGKSKFECQNLYSDKGMFVRDWTERARRSNGGGPPSASP